MPLVHDRPCWQPGLILEPQQATNQQQPSSKFIAPKGIGDFCTHYCLPNALARILECMDGPRHLKASRLVPILKRSTCSLSCYSACSIPGLCSRLARHRNIDNSKLLRTLTQQAPHHFHFAGRCPTFHSFFSTILISRRQPLSIILPRSPHQL